MGPVVKNGSITRLPFLKRSGAVPMAAGRALLRRGGVCLLYVFGKARVLRIQQRGKHEEAGQCVIPLLG
jgi:hypothetical protein